MPLLETLGLAKLTAEAIQYAVGKGKDFAFGRGLAIGPAALEKIRSCWHKLDLPENHIIQNAVILAHWKSVCQATVFYGRTHGMDVEIGLDKLGAPEWLANKFAPRAPGILSALEQ